MSPTLEAAAALAPLAALLLAIALMPMVAAEAWEHLRVKAAVSAAVGLPVASWAARAAPAALGHAAGEYVAFVVLLGALHVGAGAIWWPPAKHTTVASNARLLLAGSLLASAIGTTGAALVCLPALLAANAGRRRAEHLGVFFILMVANVGGLLTPLGDPPLFLGYLKGVPFTWTLRLWPYWLGTLGYLIAAFAWVERRRLAADPPPPRAPAAPPPGGLRGNLLPVAGLALQVGWLITAGRAGWPVAVTALGQLGLGAGVWGACGPARRRALHFAWGPWLEVAILFAGIFVALVPALGWVERHAAQLGHLPPGALFWLTGLLSSCLDNAPTYLAMAGGVAAGQGLPATALGRLAADPAGAQSLAAVSLGAVIMGAATYLGNGPNLMVRAIASQRGLGMPSFFGYVGRAMGLLLPALAAIAWALGRGR